MFSSPSLSPSVVVTFSLSPLRMSLSLKKVSCVSFLCVLHCCVGADVVCLVIRLVSGCRQLTRCACVCFVARCSSPNAVLCQTAENENEKENEIWTEEAVPKELCVDCRLSSWLGHFPICLWSLSDPLSILTFVDGASVVADP